MYTMDGRMYMLGVNIFTGFLDFLPWQDPPLGTGTPGPRYGFGGRSYHFEPLPTTFYHLPFWYPVPFWNSPCLDYIGTGLDYIFIGP